MKDKKGDLFADSHSTSNRWKYYFYELLLNVHRVNSMQTEAHTTQPLMPEPSAFEVKMAIEK